MRISLKILIFLMSINLLNGELFTPTVEFEVPLNSTNNPNEPFTPLVSFNNSTYLVWVDPNMRPVVTQKYPNEVLLTVPLDSNPDYTAYPDGHHRFSAGVDSNGYIHITGDMHFYPTVPANYLPARYQNQQIMYWISNAPNDVSKGFTFAGGLGASTAIPGQYWNTCHFFNDNNNALYYTGMIRGVYDPSVRLTGEMAVGLYKYNTSTRTWIALGGLPPAQPSYPAETQYFTSLFWEYAGTGGAAPQWFNNYWPSFQFDNNNVLHFAISANTNPSINGPNRILYAKSPDGGLTWFKANNTLIPGLPLRGADGNANRADLVADISPNIFSVTANVVPNSIGTPLIGVATETSALVNWYIPSQNSWIINPLSQHYLWGYKGLLGKNGIITMNDWDRIAVRRISSISNYSKAYIIPDALPANQITSFICMDDLALKLTGNVYGLGLSTTQNNVQVLRLNFQSSSLPGWAFLDIGTDILYGGNTDFFNDTFTIRTGGGQIYPGATSDSFHYAYQTLTNDGTIVARLSSESVSSGTCDAVMFRNGLNNNSSFFGLVLSNNYQSVLYRTAAGSATQYAGALNTPTIPLWFKITRAGNVFTGFTSTDGINWTQVGNPATFVMPSTIYVGLASTATSIQNMKVANFDNVSIISGSSYVSTTGATGK